MGPSEHYAPEIRSAAVEQFGDDGGWLAMSILHYGWRANYDLARSIASSLEWSDQMVGGSEIEFQIVRDLQIQGLLYATAEQLATLADALLAHHRGKHDFMERYTANVQLADRIGRLKDLRVAKLRKMMHAPRDVAALMDSLRVTGFMDSPPTGVVDLSTMATTEIGGLAVPQSAFDRELVELGFDQVNAMVAAVHRNIGELRQLVDAPAPPEGLDVQPEPLRAVDNSFRHGLRVLFRDALPTERRFRAVGDGVESAAHHVELYLPPREVLDGRPGAKAAPDEGSDEAEEEIRFATVDCGPDRSAHHVEAIRMLCLRMGQLIRCAVGGASAGGASFVMGASLLTLGGATDSELPPT